MKGSHPGMISDFLVGAFVGALKSDITYVTLVKRALNYGRNQIWIGRWVKNGPKISEIRCG